MRTICNGVTYDTDTAKFIEGGRADHEYSNAGWRVYQTPNGEFFKVIYGHGGEEIGFRVGRD